MIWFFVEISRSALWCYSRDTQTLHRFPIQYKPICHCRCKFDLKRGYVKITRLSFSPEQFHSKITRLYRSTRHILDLTQIFRLLLSTPRNFCLKQYIFQIFLSNLQLWTNSYAQNTSFVIA